MFQALADPTRRGLVDRLTRGPATVSELAAPLPITLAAVVQHLQVLEACGLVRTEKVGRVRSCQVDPAGLRAAEQWLHERRTAWERWLDRLAEVLDEEGTT
ncbi:DNA-binding transcriptional ArsR family regulator [Kutzneria buriramensis]|uniref:DNA-binding transcriptional ArsR family regulator n=1 Tax=Kutzneria buriramensis TaxID=1045776 RepID=A0A3E0HZL7_9PSEU|nr:DNA-binding transcriptional ArsR family regulator [Kutzneria buriramensis]